MLFLRSSVFAALLLTVSASSVYSFNDRKRSDNVRTVKQRELAVKTCSKEKTVSIYKFCIEGDCDSGAEGEHRLKLDGHWLWGGFRDFREGQCHSIRHSPKTVAAWKSLNVGTEEHDDWSENDSYFATMAASSWYSETCETYEVILAKQHTSEKRESFCWEMSAAGGAKGVDLGLTATRCTEWTKPSESFLWYLKVEPKEVSYVTFPPTSFPTELPTVSPTKATPHPTDNPSFIPTLVPSDLPSLSPTEATSPPSPKVVSSIESSLLGNTGSPRASNTRFYAMAGLFGSVAFVVLV